jgi:hypothetical protein
MVEHASFSSSHILIPEYVDTLVILTGKDTPNPYRYTADRAQLVRAAVEDLTNNWWAPNKDKLWTDLGRMSKEQLEVIAGRLVKRAEGEMRADGHRSDAEKSSYWMAALVRPDRDRRRSWYEEELDPGMVPTFLAPAGYQEDPADRNVERDGYSIPYAAVSMLGSLRRNKEAPRLHLIAEDKRQNSATRLTCLLALVAAGETPGTKMLLSILEGEKKLERRIVTILALPYSDDAKSALPQLLKLLDDPTSEIRAATVQALRGAKPKEALPRLKQMLENPKRGEPVYAALQLVAEIGTREAQTILASLLKAALEDQGKSSQVYYTLSAFQQATNQRWIEAGAHPDSYYRDRAREALEWWERQK